MIHIKIIGKCTNNNELINYISDVKSFCVSCAGKFAFAIIKMKSDDEALLLPSQFTKNIKVSKLMTFKLVSAKEEQKNAASHKFVITLK